MAQIRRGGQIQSKLAFLIYGDKGTWKSSLALEFAKMKNEKNEPMKVLYIDTEEGSIDDYVDSLANEGIDINNIFVIKTKTFAETIELVKQVKTVSATKPITAKDDETKEKVELLNEDGTPFIPDAIVIDSLTVLYNQLVQALLEMSQRRAAQRANKAGVMGAEKTLAIEMAGLEVKDYQTINHRGQELILDLMASGRHFAVIAREVEIREQKPDSNNQFQTVGTGRYKAEGFKEVDYNVKTVLHTFNKDGKTYAKIEDKDRTGVKKQNELIENPTLLDWAVVIKNNVGKKEVKITNTLEDGIKADVAALQKKVVEQTGADLVDESDYDADIDVLKNEITSMISRISDGTKRQEMKDICEKHNIPSNFKSNKDKKSLTQMRDLIKDFLTKNNIH